MSNKIKYFILFGIVLFILLSGIILIFLQKQSSQVQTANWKTQNFSKKGFSIKIPTGWKYSSLSGDPIRLGPNELLTRVTLPMPLTSELAENLENNSIIISIYESETISRNTLFKKFVLKDGAPIYFASKNKKLQNIFDEITSSFQLISNVSQ
jgi:hypothetical protein